MKTKELSILGTNHAERALEALRKLGYPPEMRIRNNQTLPLDDVGHFQTSGGCFLILVPADFKPDLSGPPGWIA